MSPGIHSKIGIPDNSITVESCSRERETKSNKKKRRKRHQAAKLLLRKSMGGGQRHCCSSRIFYPVVCRCTPRNVQIKRKDVIKTSVCVTNWITATEARTMGKKINKQTNKSNRWWAEHEKKWRSCKSVWLVHTHREREKEKKNLSFRGWVIRHTLCRGIFRRSSFDEKRRLLVDDIFICGRRRGGDHNGG